MKTPQQDQNWKKIKVFHNLNVIETALFFALIPFIIIYSTKDIFLFALLWFIVYILITILVNKYLIWE